MAQWAFAVGKDVFHEQHSRVLKFLRNDECRQAY